jgi:hypothetical protein
MAKAKNREQTSPEQPSETSAEETPIEVATAAAVESQAPETPNEVVAAEAPAGETPGSPPEVAEEPPVVSAAPEVKEEPPATPDETPTEVKEEPPVMQAPTPPPVEDEPILLCFDRILPDDRAALCESLSVAENPANRPMTASPMGMAIQVGKRWAPGRTLRVRFMGGNPQVHARIKPLVKSLEAVANVHFSFVESGEAEIRVAFDTSGGSWSYVGTEALAIPQNEPTMNFGWLTPNASANIYSSVVLHEFGHALGAIHEHQSPVATIPWNVEAVYRIYGGPPNNWDQTTIQTNVLQKYNGSGINATAFDPTSIMCYSFGPPLTRDGFSTPWNTQLSAADRQLLSAMYPSDEPVDPVPTPTPSPLSPTLLVNGVATGRLVSRNDFRLFQFNTDRTGTYTISVTMTRGNSRPVLELYADMEHLATPMARRVGLLQVNLAHTGRYVLKVVAPEQLQSEIQFQVSARWVSR